MSGIEWVIVAAGCVLGVVLIIVALRRGGRRRRDRIAFESNDATLLPASARAWCDHPLAEHCSKCGCPRFVAPNPRVVRHG